MQDNGENIKKEDPKILINPRSGWDEQFALMAKNGDDKLLIDDVFEDEEIWSY